MRSLLCARALPPLADVRQIGKIVHAPLEIVEAVHELAERQTISFAVFDPMNVPAFARRPSRVDAPGTGRGRLYRSSAAASATKVGDNDDNGDTRDRSDNQGESESPVAVDKRRRQSPWDKAWIYFGIGCAGPIAVIVDLLILSFASIATGNPHPSDTFTGSMRLGIAALESLAFVVAVALTKPKTAMRSWRKRCRHAVRRRRWLICLATRAPFSLLQGVAQLTGDTPLASALSMSSFALPAEALVISAMMKGVPSGRPAAPTRTDGRKRRRAGHPRLTIRATAKVPWPKRYSVEQPGTAPIRQGKTRELTPLQVAHRKSGLVAGKPCPVSQSLAERFELAFQE